MKQMIGVLALSGVMAFAVAPGDAVAQIAKNVAAKSPWGPTDEIGTLNMMTDASRLEVLKQVVGGKVYDLGVDLFVGMPTCCGPFGDPTFQIWMTHTPARDTAKEVLSYGYDHGGSVTSANIGEFLVEPAIDGALVGGASLQPDEMAGIVARAGVTARARAIATPAS